MRMCMIVYVCYVCICLDVYLSIYIVYIFIIYTSNEQLTWYSDQVTSSQQWNAILCIWFLYAYTHTYTYRYYTNQRKFRSQTSDNMQR